MALPTPDYLIAFDFDGTLADTFAKSPRGIGVNEASAKAVADVFGEEGRRAFAVIGGLKNRAPVELIDMLSSYGDETLMTESARQYVRHHENEFSDNVPEGKGVSLSALFHGGGVSHEVLAEVFVRRKLSILIQEISKEWPRPMPGITDALAAIHALSNEGTPVRLAVLSSGHELFIRKCFETWGVPQPDILVTDDDLRGVKYRASHEKIKPSVHLLAKLHQAWRRARGLPPDDLNLSHERTMREEGMFYMGDDIKRDGKLAMDHGVFFGWYYPTDDSAVAALNHHLFHFNHWDELTDFLTTPGLSERLQRGEPFYALLAEMRLGLPGGEFSRRPL